MFQLPQVNPKVGYADSYALGDLSDFYDLSQAPRALPPSLPRRTLSSSFTVSNNRHN